MMNIKPIHSVTDSEITDETLIYFYKGKPIYIDFLHINEYSSSGESNYFDKMKNSLTLNKCIEYNIII
jgi:hypothetical protein